MCREAKLRKVTGLGPSTDDNLVADELVFVFRPGSRDFVRGRIVEPAVRHKVIVDVGFDTGKPCTVRSHSIFVYRVLPVPCEEAEDSAAASASGARLWRPGVRRGREKMSLPVDGSVDCRYCGKRLKTPQGCWQRMRDVHGHGKPRRFGD